jgi:hypothetical protein
MNLWVTYKAGSFLTGMSKRTLLPGISCVSYVFLLVYVGGNFAVNFLWSQFQSI